MAELHLSAWSYDWQVNQMGKPGFGFSTHKHHRVTVTMRVVKSLQPELIVRSGRLLYSGCSVRPFRGLDPAGDCPDGPLEFQRRLSGTTVPILGTP